MSTKNVFMLISLIIHFSYNSFGDVIRLGRCPDVKIQRNFRHELVIL